MLLPLVASLALGTTLADLKLEVRAHEYAISAGLANGLEDAPLSRHSLRVPLPQLSGDEKAALTREALARVKAWLSTEEGQKAWALRLTPRNSYHQPLPERSAGLASSVAYWSTLTKERKEPRDAEELARATELQRAFKANRPRLDREATTRARAVASPDPASFNAQVKERLTYFLAETKQMAWDAKLEERDGRRRFVSGTLEAKPGWWKFCWRAGPEATNAAREFAAQWLAELNAPPPASKLSDDD